MTKFANSVSDLCRLIDLRINEKDYSSARCLVSDMETFLKRIVSAMLLHDDIDTRESDMILMFIRRIVEDKRTIIMEKEKNRYLVFKEDDSFLSRKKRAGRSISLLLLIRNLMIPRRSIIGGQMMMTRMTSNSYLKIKGRKTFYFFFVFFKIILSCII